MLPLRVIRLCWKSIINVKIITIILQVVWRIEPSVFPHIGQVTNVNTVKLVSGSAGRQPLREAQLTGELWRSHTLSESHSPEERERERRFRYPDCCLIKWQNFPSYVKHHSYLMSFMSPTSSNGDIPKAWNWIVYGQRHDIMEVRPFLATPRKSFSLWSLWAVERVTEMEWGEGRLETLRHNRKWKYGG